MCAVFRLLPRYAFATICIYCRTGARPVAIFRFYEEYDCKTTGFEYHSIDRTRTFTSQNTNSIIYSTLGPVSAWVGDRLRTGK